MPASGAKAQGGIDTSFNPAFHSALRHSGGMALLSALEGEKGGARMRSHDIDPRRFPHTITRKRTGPTTFNFFNEPVPGAVVETDLRASVQPISLRDLPSEAGQQFQGILLAFVPDGQAGETGAALVGAFDDVRLAGGPRGV